MLLTILYLQHLKVKFTIEYEVEEFLAFLYLQLKSSPLGDHKSTCTGQYLNFCSLWTMVKRTCALVSIHLLQDELVKLTTSLRSNRFPLKFIKRYRTNMRSITNFSTIRKLPMYLRLSCKGNGVAHGYFDVSRKQSRVVTMLLDCEYYTPQIHCSTTQNWSSTSCTLAPNIFTNWVSV